MANNQYVNKFVYGGETKFDISGTTATAEDVAQGKVFFTASGAQAVGTATGGGGALCILVTASTGSTVTAEKDGSTYAGVEDAENPGSYSIAVPSYGTYTVTATLRGQRASESVTLTEESVEFDEFLPEGYTRLEYIESTGTQFIDSGYVINANDVIELDADLVQLQQGLLFGAVSGSTSNSVGRENNANGLFAQFSSNWVYTHITSTERATHIININNMKYTIYGATFNIPGLSIINANIYLFCGNNEGAAILNTKYKLYYFQIISDGSNKSLNLVPAKRNSDDVIGLYDIVRNQFFTNAGSGTFIAGPEVA